MFTPKGLAKATAKGTGKALVQDYRDNINVNNHIYANVNMPSTSNDMNHIYSNDSTSVVPAIQGSLPSPPKSHDFLPEKK